MNENLKLIRSILKLSQNELGFKLGVTGSSISKLEKGGTKFTEQMIKTICREFNINEDWFRTGNGEIFIENDSALEQCLKENNANDNDIELIKCYLNLDLEIRNKIHEHFKCYFSSIK